MQHRHQTLKQKITVYEDNINGVLSSKQPVHFESHSQSNACVPISDDAVEHGESSGLLLVILVKT